MRIPFSLPILLALGGWPAHGGIVVTSFFNSDSFASFKYLGVTYAQGQIGSENASQAIVGTPPYTPELRTAGRVNTQEIAANARLDDHFTFSYIGITANFTRTSYGALIESETPEHLSVRFYLPPSYVEVSSFIEAPDAVLHAHIAAQIKIMCPGDYSPVCNPLTTPFSFDAQLDASYSGFTRSSSVYGQPGLDLTPLQNPTLTDVVSNDLRTTNLAFPAFSGMLDLGQIGLSTPIGLSYELDAKVTGTSAANVGLASINDPFSFASDPVQQGAPASVPNAEVAAPEPGTGGLLLAALFAVAHLHARRRSRSSTSDRILGEQPWHPA